jgi:hypothetical protein
MAKIGSPWDGCSGVTMNKDNYRIEILNLPPEDKLTASPEEMVSEMRQQGFRPEFPGDFKHWTGHHHWTGPVSDLLDVHVQELWRAKVSGQVEVRVTPIG